MALIGETRFLERLQFFDGQRLFASDLQAMEAFDREMRWLHNQSLHQPGVGLGYTVTGDRGAREITVEPGYAIDHLGREIVLTAARTLSVPPTAGDRNGEPVHYDLTVAYPDEGDLEESETREGICLPRGVVRRREEPVLCWVELGPGPAFQPVDAAHKRDIERGRLIHLARAQVLGCKLEQPLSDAQRRSAKPPDRPHVACGSTAGEPWTVTVSAPVGAIIEQPVDTSAAGFRTPPCYSAHVVGDRVFEINGAAVPIDGFTSVHDPHAGGFDLALIVPALLLQLVYPQASLNSPPMRDAMVEDLQRRIAEGGWHVEWIGVEG